MKEKARTKNDKKKTSKIDNEAQNTRSRAHGSNSDLCVCMCCTFVVGAFMFAGGILRERQTHTQTHAGIGYLHITRLRI